MADDADEPAVPTPPIVPTPKARPRLEVLIPHLRNNPDYRAAFRRDPGRVLSAAGIDPAVYGLSGPVDDAVIDRFLEIWGISDDFDIPVVPQEISMTVIYGPPPRPREVDVQEPSRPIYGPAPGPVRPRRWWWPWGGST